jgi:hypothetical protein
LSAAIALPRLAQWSPKYFPQRDERQRKLPAELGFDTAKLREAIAYAQANGGSWDFAKDQVRVFGAQLGPVPSTHAATNGIILRHGYIVAEFGDTTANDPVYSVAKSFLSTVCGLVRCSPASSVPVASIIGKSGLIVHRIGDTGAVAV